MSRMSKLWKDFGTAERVQELFRMSPKELAAKAEELCEQNLRCWYCKGDLRTSRKRCCIAVIHVRRGLVTIVVDALHSGAEYPSGD